MDSLNQIPDESESVGDAPREAHDEVQMTAPASSVDAAPALAEFNRPAATFAPPPAASPSAPRRSGMGVKIFALVAVVAMLFGAIGGAAAGFAVGSDDNNAVATTTTTTNPAAEVSTGVTPSSDSTISDIVARVNPAVVTIQNTMEGQVDQFGQSQSGVATGTGYIIDEAGHIVTNNHVVEGAQSLKVIFSDGTETPATLVGTDPFQDVAVVKIDGPVPATVSFGDSDKLRAGDPVIAIGSALGEFHNTVTDGIVSAVGRSLDTGEGYELGHLIQHNAPISPGNSGGPLVNMAGEVVGMNTAVVRGSSEAQAEGLGFAIAGNTVKEIAGEIINSGSPERPFLGVSYADARTVDENLDGGVVIEEVVSGGPAEQAGIKVGDIITEIDGVAIDDTHPFLNQMFDHKPGDTVQLTVKHENGQTETVSVTLGTRPA